MGRITNKYLPGIHPYPGLSVSEMIFRTADYEATIGFTNNNEWLFSIGEDVVLTIDSTGLAGDTMLPDQTSHAGEFLTTDGSESSWTSLAASDMSDFQTTVSANTDVAANTLKVSYTDAAKVAGIEALADVTDATNVAAAGAIMDGDFTVNGPMERTGAGAYSTTVVRKATESLTTGANGITFSSTMGATNYVLMPYCYDASGNSVSFQITSRTATGFSITVPVNSTLDYKAELIS